MDYNLLNQPWIPFLRRSGKELWGSPAAIVNDLSGDPIVAVSTGRADFDGALTEFLVGLLSAACSPGHDDSWLDYWHAPPSVADLAAAFEKLPSAFELDGDGPRLFQDFSSGDFAKLGVIPIDRLLIDSPGEQGISLNTDLFVKRLRVERLGRPSAAMALVTMQTYAPSGGQGHRTSLRGGGPLSTLVDPRVDDQGASRALEQPLWLKLWANVETKAQLANRAPNAGHTGSPNIFPWLTPTRTSNPRAGGRETTAADAHPLQAYFGLPRRIRLEFGGPGRCDLTGLEDDNVVVGFRMINYGVQYTHWRHPLTPYYRAKGKGEEWLPVHGQPGGIGWRDWLSLALNAPTEDRKPAQTVAAFDRRGTLIGLTRPRVHAFGYDLDNMKVSSWVDGTLPGFAIDDSATRKRLHDSASAIANATGLAATALVGAVRDTLFPGGEDSDGDLGVVRSALWASTEAAFYDAIRRLAAPDLDPFRANDEAVIVRREYQKRLEGCALAVFDRWCPSQGTNPAVLRRRVTSRYNLSAALRGFSKLGEKLFDALEIPHPGGGRESRATRKRSRIRPKKEKEASE